MNTTDVLLAISATEECNFNEFLNGLPEIPSDSEQWKELFQQLDHLASAGLVSIDRGYNNRINGMQLTQEGIEHAKEAIRNGKARNDT